MTCSPLIPRQIVYLACEQSRLYAEVIQVLEARQLCWARPLLLVTPEQTWSIYPSMAFGQPESSQAWSAPKAPDLIWPMEQFSPALDSDFLALFSAPLADTSENYGSHISALLTQFIRRLWETTVKSP